MRLRGGQSEACRIERGETRHQFLSQRRFGLSAGHGAATAGSTVTVLQYVPHKAVCTYVTGECDKPSVARLHFAPCGVKPACAMANASLSA